MLYTTPVTPNLVIVIIVLSFKRQNLHNLNDTKPTWAQWDPKFIPSDQNYLYVFHKAKPKLLIACQIQKYFR